MIKVYARLDSNNVIVEINSEIFLENVEGYTLIDEGTGDKYAHAQGNYLPDSLIDELGRYNYKYQDKKIVKLTEDEKEALFPKVDSKPSDFEVLKENQERTDQAVQDLIIMMMGGE